MEKLDGYSNENIVKLGVGQLFSVLHLLCMSLHSKRKYVDQLSLYEHQLAVTASVIYRQTWKLSNFVDVISFPYE